MWFKKKIRNAVYHYYLQGIPTFHISQLFEGKLGEDDIDEIIDYLNEFYA
jgi:hypothetical protein